jgi:hypothetical protein
VEIKVAAVKITIHKIITLQRRVTFSINSYDFRNALRIKKPMLGTSGKI